MIRHQMIASLDRIPQTTILLRLKIVEGGNIVEVALIEASANMTENGIGTIMAKTEKATETETLKNVTENVDIESTTIKGGGMKNNILVIETMKESEEIFRSSIRPTADNILFIHSLIW